MTSAIIKRFYKEVSLVPQDGLYCVALDGRIAKTAGRQPLGAPSGVLAQAIAEEWDAQETQIDLSAMPLTRLQGFVLDGRGVGRTEWRDEVVKYAESDLLCYRASDAELARRQAEIWQPILETVGARLGGSFAITEGVIAIDQPKELLDSFKAHLDAHDGAGMLAMKLMTSVLGSAILASAVSADEVDTEAAFSASRLDETFQNEQWGIDAEAAAREALIRDEFETIVRFLRLSRGQSV